MRKAVKDARRSAGASDENGQRAANRQMRTDESYLWIYQASTNANAFMTPDRDKQQQQQQDFDWHYQETPPARIQHSRQPKMYRQAEDAGGGDGDDAARGFKTREPDSRAARGPPTTHAPANNHSTTHTSDGEPQYQTAAEFAQSQYRRRNRLEKRLEELQKDVASLTLKLRSSSNRSNSTGYLSTDKQVTPPLPQPPLPEIPLNAERIDRGERVPMQQQMQQKVLKPPSPVVKIKKTRADKQRTIRSNLSEHSATPTKGRMSSHVSVSTMRELHKVTTERDQLKFELEKVRKSPSSVSSQAAACTPITHRILAEIGSLQMKRTLTTTEKKYEEAMKAREALEKLKAHCESLQESLDLSEKIRVRQKKLLQQLQLNQQQAQAQQMQQQKQMQKPRRTTDAPPPAAALKTREAPAARPATRKKQTSATHPTSDLVHEANSRYSTQQYQQPGYDILDSLVNQRAHLSNARASSQDHQQLGHRAPVTATTTRSTLHSGSTMRPRPGATATSGFTYADFDSLLQKVHSPHPYTMMAQPSTATAFGRRQQSARLSRREHQPDATSAGANPSGSTYDHNANKTDKRRRELHESEAWKQQLTGADASESPAHAGAAAAQTRRAQTTVHLDRYEIEMKIILEESQQLSLLCERMAAKNAAADDADISLTGLPDLSLPLIELETSHIAQQLKPKLIKRISSRDSSVPLTPKRIKPRLSRSQSQRFQGDDSSSGLASTQSSFRRTTDQKTQEKLTLFREIVRRIDGYMKRKHLRVIDLFRFCDADGNGSISPQEMIDTLSQMEIQLTVEQGQDFINYIDKDGNGSLDIDEFEELVRVARRNEAQRDLEWSKKSNRFLDQSWISQFDSQMERAVREFELL